MEGDWFVHYLLPFRSIAKKDILYIAALIAGRKDDQCSKRYNDILNPSVRNRLEDWSPHEDWYLTAKVAELGNKWAAIAPGLPGRPPLTCRNRWRKLTRASQKERIQTRSGGGGGSDSATSNNETELASVALSTPVADTPMTSTSTSTSTTTSTSISVSSSRRESRRLGTPSLAFEGGIASPLALAGGDTIPSTLFDTQDATAVPGSGTGQLPTVPTGNSYSLSQQEAEETFTALDGDAADAFIQSLGLLNDQGEGGWDMNIDPALGLEADIGQPQQTIQGNRDPVQAPSSAEIATDSVEEAVREALASFTQQHPGHRAGMQQQQQQQHYMHHVHVHHHHYHHHYHHHKYQS